MIGLVISLQCSRPSQRPTKCRTPTINANAQHSQSLNRSMPQMRGQAVPKARKWLRSNSPACGALGSLRLRPTIHHSRLTARAAKRLVDRFVFMS
jgi:hypothetical protein